jgi:transcriptional regulator with XRE-family HTH domain
MAIHIGAVILQLRKEKQLTQEQLAEILGVSTTAVCKWETGSSHPDIELLPVLADFFGTSVDRLLGYDMDKQESHVHDLLHAGSEFILYVTLWYAYVKGVAGDKANDVLFKQTMKKDQ